ncbi:MAG: twin-arginine translocase TatA/TatE family subunit [Chloroflexi bacterium]|nr:twin-arginine translocase TatA/TatE family subunit [Chloroflexota bacterium]
MPFGFGPLELFLLLVIVLIIFGVGRLPQVGGALGKSIRDLRRAVHDEPGESPQSRSNEH